MIETYFINNLFNLRTIGNGVKDLAVGLGEKIFACANEVIKNALRTGTRTKSIPMQMAVSSIPLFTMALVRTAYCARNALQQYAGVQKEDPNQQDFKVIGPDSKEYVFSTSEEALAKIKELFGETFTIISTEFAAATLAIGTYDLGASVGGVVATLIGRTISKTGLALNYAARRALTLVCMGLFAGLFESMTRLTVKKTIQFVTDPIKRHTLTEMVHRSAKDTALIFAKVVGLNATIGAIPGLVWKVTLALTLTALLTCGCPVIPALIATGVCVALSCIAANYVCKRAIKYCSKAINEKIGWDQFILQCKNKVTAEQILLNILDGTMQFTSKKPHENTEVFKLIQEALDKKFLSDADFATIVELHEKNDKNASLKQYLLARAVLQDILDGTISFISEQSGENAAIFGLIQDRLENGSFNDTDFAAIVELHEKKGSLKSFLLSLAQYTERDSRVGL